MSKGIPEQKINSICVYCASGDGSRDSAITAARALGKILAENGIRLVYGGGSKGLMGFIAQSVLDNGGEVLGFIPEWLIVKEGRLEGATQISVKDMHERKQRMFEAADAFIALPGGIGTLEELVEQLTWKQLGRHKKPIVLFDIDGFWDPLLALLDNMSEWKYINYAGKYVDLPVAHHADTILGMMYNELSGASTGNGCDRVPISAL